MIVNGRIQEIGSFRFSTASLIVAFNSCASFPILNIIILSSYAKQDENRYNASRGAHLNLKRAEKARILVNKIPGMYGMEPQPPSDTVILNYIQLFAVNVNKTKNTFIVEKINIVSFGENAALVETLVAKTRAWEETHDMSFTYDGVPLLAMLDEYAMLRHEREEEKRRMRVSFTDAMIRTTDFQINWSIF